MATSLQRRRQHTSFAQGEETQNHGDAHTRSHTPAPRQPRGHYPHHLRPAPSAPSPPDAHRARPELDGRRGPAHGHGRMALSPRLDHHPEGRPMIAAVYARKSRPEEGKHEQEKKRHPAEGRGPS